MVDSPRGRTVAARKTIPGRAAAEVLAEVLPRVVGGLSFPKTMRWGAGDRSFVRPVRGVVALLGGRIVPLELYGVPAGDRTTGHRVLADGEIVVTGPDEYLAKLRRSFVEPDPEVRRIAILESARALAAEVGGQVEADADLASTLADLVEWPGRRARRVRRGVPRPARRDHGHRHADAPEVPAGARAGGLMPHFVAVMDNRGPEGLDRQGLRVGPERPSRGRPFLPRRRRAGNARIPAPAAVPALLPGAARRLPAEDGAAGGARRDDRGALGSRSSTGSCERRRGSRRPT